MANHASAKKRIRQTERRSTINRNRLSRVRTFIKKVELAIDAGDADVAKELLKEAQPSHHAQLPTGCSAPEYGVPKSFQAGG